MELLHNIFAILLHNRQNLRICMGRNDFILKAKKIDRFEKEKIGKLASSQSQSIFSTLRIQPFAAHNFLIFRPFYTITGTSVSTHVQHRPHVSGMGKDTVSNVQWLWESLTFVAGIFHPTKVINMS